MADNLSKEAQTLVDSSKRAYRRELESFNNYSDEEIQMLMYDAMQKGLAASNTYNMADAYKYIGQKDACVEILEERKSERLKSEKAEKEWPDLMRQLQNEAVLNLKTAITPNAQLIAAVLEEEGDLTEDELAGWCDELASLPEDEFRDLLSGMENEKVISRKDGKYHLHDICTSSLFPEDIERFMQERLPDNTVKDKRNAVEFKIMDMLSAFGAKTPYSVPSEMELYAKLRPDDVLNEENVKDHWMLRAGPRISAVLRGMADKGLLHRYIVPSNYAIYYFPMLGLKEDK